MDRDERVAEAIRVLFRKFRELGSARQVLLWAIRSDVKLPVTGHGSAGIRIEWSRPAYHTVVQILEHPVYAGAYVFGRTTQRTAVVDGRARKPKGYSKPMKDWSLLLRNHTPGISRGISSRSIKG